MWWTWVWSFCGDMGNSIISWIVVGFVYSFKWYRVLCIHLYQQLSPIHGIRSAFLPLIDQDSWVHHHSSLKNACSHTHLPKYFRPRKGFLGGGGVPGQRRLSCPPIRIFLLLFPKYCDYRHGVHCIIVEVNKKVFSFKGISQWGANLG